MIIALCGLPRCGKDTFASFFKDRSDIVQYAFADPIRKLVCDVFSWKEESFQSDSKDEIDPFWKVSKRQMLEFFGDAVCKKQMCENFPEFNREIGNNIWVKRFEFFLKENKDKHILITDLRFQPEYDFLKTLNTKIIFLNRANYIQPSIERWYDIKNFKFNYILTNKTLDQFKVDSISLVNRILGENNE